MAPGLFQYFRKATDEEWKEYLAQMDEEIKTQMEKEDFYSQKAKLEWETKYGIKVESVNGFSEKEWKTWKLSQGFEVQEGPNIK